MDTIITDFTEKEKKRKNIHRNESGDTVMYDKNGRRWTLAGEFDTIEEAKSAESLVLATSRVSNRY